jgi:plastocyanin
MGLFAERVLTSTGESSMKRTCCILGIAALAMVAAMVAGRSRTFASAAPQAQTPGEVTVTIENFSFSPGTITVPAGSTVRWTNKDDSPHNIVSEDKSFKSKTLDTDDHFSQAFAKPGTYGYYCGLHPKMQGKIVVR